MIRPPRILLADDDRSVLDAMASYLSRAGYPVTSVPDGERALLAEAGEPFDLVVSDLKMPGMGGLELLKALRARGSRVPFVLLTAYGTVETAVEAMKHGACDFLLKPFLPAQLERVLRDALGRGEAPAPVPPPPPGDEPPPVAESRAMREAMAMARMVAPSGATVLLTGESGTGKEVVARGIHGLGTGAGAPFVAVNCAAMPEGLLESELFGHEKGAFSGALSRRPGKFELADGGTLLLDEIGEMDIRLQAKLLRALQERAFERVGGTAPVRVRLRVIATTNRDLREAVRQGAFREDLFFRLNVFPIRLAPLRERPEDVLPLARRFADRFAAEAGLAAPPPFTKEAERFLASLPYPGNVRELMNRVERALLLSPAAPIGPAALRDPSESSAEEAAGLSSWPDAPAIRPGTSVRDMEKALILDTLRATEGNRNRAAAELGISVRTLRNKLAAWRTEGEAAP